MNVFLVPDGVDKKKKIKIKNELQQAEAVTLLVIA